MIFVLLKVLCSMKTFFSFFFFFFSVCCLAANKSFWSTFLLFICYNGFNTKVPHLPPEVFLIHSNFTHLSINLAYFFIDFFSEHLFWRPKKNRCQDYISSHYFVLMGGTCSLALCNTGASVNISRYLSI